MSISAATLLSLLCLALLSLSSCSAQSGSSGVVIYSASGCTDVGTVTLNCTFPATITLQTSVIAAAQLPYISIAVTGPDSQLPVYTQSFNSLSLNDSVTFTLTPQGYSPSLVGPMLSIQLFHILTGNLSQPFTGLSLAPIAAPVLQSISGCTGSGSATLGCQPDVTTLTLTGQGLSWMAGGYYSLCIASSCTSVTGGGANGSSTVSVLSDSLALVALSNIYTYLLLPAHYGGGQLPLYFSLPPWNFCQHRAQASCTHLSGCTLLAAAELPPASLCR